MPAQAHEPEAPAEQYKAAVRWLADVAAWDTRATPHCIALMDEIENLRATLRAVRGSTDPAWAARLISYALRENRP
jgi:hypothetical protein